MDTTGDRRRVVEWMGYFIYEQLPDALKFADRMGLVHNEADLQALVHAKCSSALRKCARGKEGRWRVHVNVRVDPLPYRCDVVVEREGLPACLIMLKSSRLGHRQSPRKLREDRRKLKALCRETGANGYLLHLVPCRRTSHDSPLASTTRQTIGARIVEITVTVLRRSRTIGLRELLDPLDYRRWAGGRV